MSAFTIRASESPWRSNVQGTLRPIAVAIVSARGLYHESVASVRRLANTFAQSETESLRDDRDVLLQDAMEKRVVPKVRSSDNMRGYLRRIEIDEAECCGSRSVCIIIAAGLGPR